MRKWILLAAIAATAFLTASLDVNRARAMTIGTPAGLGVAADEVNGVEDAAYVCRRVWRCGDWGCGWRRSCWWTGPRYYRDYGWRRRHWRHHRYRW